ncbi:MAG: hypothetical protein SAMD01599839_10970 [Rectinema sp.]
MRPRRLAMLMILLLVLASLFGAGAQPVVSTKQDIAVFALGYYGWFIPSQALGTIDLKIQKVFSDIGRFTVFGTTQRLSSDGLQQFIDALRQTKQADFVLPEQYQFGEAFLTKAEFERLTGAFIVVVPVVTNFAVYWNSKAGTWNCNITTGITFIDVAHDATVLSIESIDTSGSDKTNHNNAIMSAINAIPSELEYRIRSIPEFQINTRILEAKGSTVKIQLGANMGLKKGDEYAIIEKQTVGGIEDTREAGLIMITDVSQQLSTGRVLYRSGALDANTQLKEIARRGVDLDLYFHTSGTEILPGFRATASRGYFPLRPYIGVQMPVSLAFNVLTVTVIPVNAIFGAEFMMPMGRLHVAPYAGAGFTYAHLTEALSGYETDYLSHIGFQAGGRVGYLINRNMRLFADAGIDYWLSLGWPFSDYGGLTLGAGVSFKL